MISVGNDTKTAITKPGLRQVYVKAITQWKETINFHS